MSKLYRLVLATLCLSVAAHAEEPPLPSADSVIARHVNAVGGEAALAEVAAVRIAGSFEVGAAQMSGTFVSLVASPALYRVTISLEGFGEFHQGLWQGTAWDDDTMQGPRVLDAEAAHVRSLRADPQADLHYATHFKTLETTGFTEFQEQPVVAVHCVTEQGYEQTDYFSTESGLLVGRKFVEPMGDGGGIDMTLAFHDYQDQNGRLMPMRQVTRGDMGEQIITIEQVSFEPIPEAEFTPPAEILKQIEAKAAMPGK